MKLNSQEGRVESSRQRDFLGAVITLVMHSVHDKAIVCKNIAAQQLWLPRYDTLKVNIQNSISNYVAYLLSISNKIIQFVFFEFRIPLFLLFHKFTKFAILRLLRKCSGRYAFLSHLCRIIQDLEEQFDPALCISLICAGYAIEA